ncbi:hypothetical protein Hanom_Chr15g01394871 [Helianthus anomalus]
MDLILQLPESIVHRILTFLVPLHTPPSDFVRYIEYTTSRFCHQNLAAYTLRLITDLRESAELDIVNRCLELLLQNGVYDLVIGVANSSESPFASTNYRLPNILLSISVLDSLDIGHCELPSSFMLDVAQNLLNE